MDMMETKHAGRRHWSNVVLWFCRHWANVCFCWNTTWLTFQHAAMLTRCWAGVVDGGPTLTQHEANVLCCLDHLRCYLSSWKQSSHGGPTCQLSSVGSMLEQRHILWFGVETALTWHWLFCYFDRMIFSHRPECCFALFSAQYILYLVTN